MEIGGIPSTELRLSPGIGGILSSGTGEFFQLRSWWVFTPRSELGPSARSYKKASEHFPQGICPPAPLPGTAATASFPSATPCLTPASFSERIMGHGIHSLRPLPKDQMRIQCTHRYCGVYLPSQC